LTGTLSLTLIAGHIWQGPIPSRKLQRLKSFAMTGLKNFWVEDFEEYSNYQFIPYEDDWTLSIETEADGLEDVFDEENTLEQFLKIELHYESGAPVEIELPPGLTLPQLTMQRIRQKSGRIDRYIASVKNELSSTNGFSSISLEPGGFQAIIAVDVDQAPKSMDDIYLVISKGSTKLGSFEYIHGICISGEYYDFSDYEDGSYCDLYQHTYYDEKFNFMCSFNQWFAGLEVEEISERYVSSVDDELIKAYVATDFQVNTDPTFILKIGRYSGELSELYKQHNCKVSAYITAWNPLGKIVSNSENKRLNNALKSSISEKYKLIEGIGRDPDGKWPGEESFLVLGINREDAMKLGKQFEQNAIVFNEDQVPELIMLK
jgi:hypothetical protein